MRIPIKAKSVAAKIVDLTQIPDSGVTIDVITPQETLWLSESESQLNTGKPGSAGKPIIAGQSLTLNPFAGVLWAVANAPIEAEIQIFPSKSREVLPARRGAITPPRKSDCEDTIFCPLEELIARVKVLPFLIAFFFLPLLACGQDRQRNCGQSDFPGICNLETSQDWGTGNQTWIFRPTRPDANVIIFIHNNNPTSAHTSQSVQVFQTPFPDAADLSNNASRWTQATVTQNPTTGATCLSVNQANDFVPGASGTGICYITAAYATQIAVKMIGATAAAGTPDTFDLQIVQEVAVPQPLGNQNVSLAAGATVAANVQGVIPQGQNGDPIFPVLGGAYQVPVNTGFAALGLDTFGGLSFLWPRNFSGTKKVFNPIPIPSTANGWGLGLVQINCAQAIACSGPLAPWVCVTGTNCKDGSVPLPITLSFAANGGLIPTPVQYTATNTNGGFDLFDFGVFLDFAGVATVRQFNVANNPAQALPGNSLAGSTIVFAASCSSAPTNASCSWQNPTDTQGLQWRPVACSINAPGGSSGGLCVWMPTGLSSAAAETVTAHANPGTTTGGASIVELTGLPVAAANTPSVKLFASNRTFIAGEDDNGGLFIEHGGFSTGTITLKLGPTTGTSQIPLWQQNQHGIFDSCVLSIGVTGVTGTAPTMDLYLQDGADGIRWNDRAHFPQFTATGNFLGAISGGSGGITPVATTDAAMAVSTKLDGPPSSYGQLKIVLAGTNPVFTFTYSVVCR